MRETALPGAVLTRVAASHIRVGTFQFFAARRDTDGVRRSPTTSSRGTILSWTVPRPYRALLDGVVARQAELVARWLLVGFIHGVMNTDNTSISGETIDYGPCAFLDGTSPARCSARSIRWPLRLCQPAAIALWNLARLAESLLPLIEDDQATSVAQAETILGEFPENSPRPSGRTPPQDRPVHRAGR